MRKLIPSLVAAFLLAFTFAFTFVSGASAQTIQASQTSQYAQLPSGHASPDASGGGCGSWHTNGTGDITAKACISYAYPYLQPDGYASFKKLSNHGNIQNCRFRLTVYENGSFYTRIDYNCTVAAAQNQQNAHFGPLSIFVTGSSSWYSTVQVTLDYQDGFITNCYPPRSPTQYI